MFEFKGSNRLKAVAYRAAAAFVGGNASLHFRLGSAEARRGNWPQARDAYLAALARNQDPVAWHLSLGIACEKTKRWDEAASAYVAALARDDTDPSLHWRLGLIRAKLRDWPEAVKAFEEATALDPENTEYSSRLAKARFKLKDWSGAAAAYNAALARDPNNAAFHGRVGILRIKLKDWLAAAAAFEAAVTLNPDNALCHERLGFVRSRLGHWNRAVAAYEAAVTREPNNAAWLGSLGWAQTRLGNWPAAARTFEAALKLRPDNPTLHSRLGSAQAKLRDWAGARKAYEAAIVLDEGNINLHRRLANTMFKAQDWSRAAASLSRVLEAGADDDLVRRRLAYCRAKDGNKTDAIALLQPNAKRSDAWLQAFLAREQDKDQAAALVESEILFVPGAHTALARKVCVNSPKGGEKIYFEHTRVGASRCRWTLDFYHALGKSSSKEFLQYVPKLHFHLLDDEYGYFLFEFLEHAAGTGSAQIQKMALEDERFGNRLVDTLVELAWTDVAVRGLSPDVKPPRHSVIREIEPYFKGQTLLHADDRSLVSRLERLTENWGDHRAKYETLPKVMAHRHLHDNNIAVSPDGQISIFDWEIYGYAPVGYDLVTLFRDSWEHERFEQLAKRYFENVRAQIPNAEQSYVISILVAQESALLQKPIPMKWLNHISEA